MTRALLLILSNLLIMSSACAAEANAYFGIGAGYLDPKEDDSGGSLQLKGKATYGLRFGLASGAFSYGLTAQRYAYKQNVTDGVFTYEVEALITPVMLEGNYHFNTPMSGPFIGLRGGVVIQGAEIGSGSQSEKTEAGDPAAGAQIGWQIGLSNAFSLGLEANYIQIFNDDDDSLVSGFASLNFWF